MIAFPCQSGIIHAETSTFGQSVNCGRLTCDALNEASGLAMSHHYTNVLWSHNDSGDESRLYAMSTQGKHLGIFQLRDIEVIDCEDMTIGPGPITDTSFIYLGDIGDNKARRNVKTIYRLKEPVIPDNSKDIHWIDHFDCITFQYPDGSRDAETLLLDPKTRDLYVVSKREKQVGIYRLSYPQFTASINMAEKVATIPLSWVVGGDLSPDGNELLIKTEGTVYYWKKNDQADFVTFFSSPNLVSVPYTRELQGEAICWFRQSMGYFTVSEEPWRFENNDAHVTFYPRLTLMDINQDLKIDIADIMYYLETVAGRRQLPRIPLIPDINHNGKIALEEIIYGLQMLIRSEKK